MLQPPTMPSACTPTVCVPDATRLVKGRALRRSKLLVLVDELGRVVGVVVSVEGVCDRRLLDSGYDPGQEGNDGRGCQPALVRFLSR